MGAAFATVEPGRRYDPLVGAVRSRVRAPPNDLRSPAHRHRRTIRDGATFDLVMDDIRDQFAEGRHKMIGAIADLTTLALRAGADSDRVEEIQAEFFDGNMEIKKAFRVVLLLAELSEVRRRDGTAPSTRWDIWRDTHPPRV